MQQCLLPQVACCIQMYQMWSARMLSWQWDFGDNTEVLIKCPLMLTRLTKHNFILVKSFWKPHFWECKACINQMCNKCINKGLPITCQTCHNNLRQEAWCCMYPNLWFWLALLHFVTNKNFDEYYEYSKVWTSTY